jgi:hypothetical protein
MHDLDRGRSGPSPHRAQVGHKRRLRALPSAQIQPIPHTNPLVNADEMPTALTVLLAPYRDPVAGAGNDRAQRSELNAARTSVEKSSGSSQAAKWPPLSTSLK